MQEEPESSFGPKGWSSVPVTWLYDQTRPFYGDGPHGRITWTEDGSAVFWVTDETYELFTFDPKSEEAQEHLERVRRAALARMQEIVRQGRMEWDGE